MAGQTYGQVQGWLQAGLLKNAAPSQLTTAMSAKACARIMGSRRGAKQSGQEPVRVEVVEVMVVVAVATVGTAAMTAVVVVMVVAAMVVAAIVVVKEGPGPHSGATLPRLM